MSLLDVINLFSLRLCTVVFTPLSIFSALCIYTFLLYKHSSDLYLQVFHLFSALFSPSPWSLESADFGPGDTFRVPLIDSDALETLYLGTCIIIINGKKMFRNISHIEFHLYIPLRCMFVSC